MLSKKLMHKINVNLNTLKNNFILSYSLPLKTFVSLCDIKSLLLEIDSLTVNLLICDPDIGP
jgi:hypothetical protein